MPYSIIICDDCLPDAEAVAVMVRDWAARAETPVRTQIFPSAEAFLFHYAEDKSCDLLLLDVEMNAMSGIDLAREIRRENRRVEIVFITSHFEFCGEGYEVDALHYLPKPVSAAKLAQVLDKAIARLSADAAAITLSCVGETVRVAEEDILYAETSLHYLTIHTVHGSYTVRENISAFEQRLSGGFFRIHRSYLVSLRRITRISRTSVTLCGTIELPLARGNYDAVNRAFIEYN
ncbi:MAG: LytR/AlgR family response regulator transcription factor [Eubacteriales bacterium]